MVDFSKKRITQNELDNEPRLLPFEKLDAYQVAISLTDIVGTLKSKRHCSNPLDHLRRASVSVVLNIAEACGRNGADRKQFFAIARGSALESAAALRILKSLKGIGDNDYVQARSYCERLYAMLTRLCRS